MVGCERTDRVGAILASGVADRVGVGRTSAPVLCISALLVRCRLQGLLKPLLVASCSNVHC